MIIGLYSDNPQSGKTTVAEILMSTLPNASVKHFATPVKKTLLTLLTQLHVDNPHDYLLGDKKADIIPELGVTGGYLMSTFATDYMRSINPDVWLNALVVLDDPDALTIIDDLRFPNEFQWISTNGVTIKIVRNAPNHDRSPLSEGQLSRYYFTYVIDNNGTLDDLIRQVYLIAQDILNAS